MGACMQLWIKQSHADILIVPKLQDSQYRVQLLWHDNFIKLKVIRRTDITKTRLCDTCVVKLQYMKISSEKFGYF